MEFKNIASSFSFKSDAILSEIMEKYNLDMDKAMLPLTAITMYLSRNEISEKEAVDLIKKEFNVSQQTAEQITKEIKNNLIPTLWDRMPDAEREALLNNKKAPTFLNAENNKSGLEAPIKKSAGASRLPKKDFQPEKPRQSSGPDSYREPIS